MVRHCVLTFLADSKACLQYLTAWRDGERMVRGTEWEMVEELQATHKILTPCGSNGKESTFVGVRYNPWIGRSPGWHRNPLSILGRSHGQRNRENYEDPKKSGMTSSPSGTPSESESLVDLRLCTSADLSFMGLVCDYLQLCASLQCADFN